MENERIRIEVTGIRREEYYQACQVNARRLYILMAAAMAVICGAILLAMEAPTIRAVIAPVIIYVVVVAAWEIIYRVSYKGQLENLENAVCYEFYPAGWTVTTGDQRVDIDWRATTKYQKTKNCIFVYNEGASGNLLPRRLLTPEQEEQIYSWYKATRIIAKDYQRAEERKRRREYKDTHKGLRFGSTGPAWGPFRRR